MTLPLTIYQPNYYTSIFQVVYLLILYHLGKVFRCINLLQIIHYLLLYGSLIQRQLIDIRHNVTILGEHRKYSPTHIYNLRIYLLEWDCLHFNQYVLVAVYVLLEDKPLVLILGGISHTLPIVGSCHLGLSDIPRLDEEGSWSGQGVQYDVGIILGRHPMNSIHNEPEPTLGTVLREVDHIDEHGIVVEEQLIIEVGIEFLILHLPIDLICLDNEEPRFSYCYIRAQCSLEIQLLLTLSLVTE